ncbi:MAG: hypothetical protein HFF63_03645 [Oscillospiraceae bacterium]|nr:hypothetical protein [Oscillospiraceae bacterium]
MVAIVTDVHYRMSLALIRDLAQAGVEVITCEQDRCRDSRTSPALGALSRYVSRHVWLPGGTDGLEALLSLCRETGLGRDCRPALLPAGAATLALIAENRERFEPLCGLCVPTAEQLDLLNSKPRLAALAARLGVPLPESMAPGEDLDRFLDRQGLPCVIKPACGEKLGLTAAARYAVASTREEARAAWERFSRLAGEPPVVQGYLPGRALGCSVLARSGQVMAAICHQRVREYPVSGGPSSCCQCVEREDIRTYAARLTAETGLTGLAMFEFKEDRDGAPRLLECNPRVWGTFPLTRVSGSGIPLLWCALAWNAGNPDNPAPLPALTPPRGRRMIFAASDLMAAAGYARRGSPGRALGALGDLLNPWVRDGLFEWGDMLPALAYFRSLLAKERR